MPSPRRYRYRTDLFTTRQRAKAVVLEGWKAGGEVAPELSCNSPPPGRDQSLELRINRGRHGGWRPGRLPNEGVDHKTETNGVFRGDPQEFIAKADENWPKLHQ